MNLLPRQRSIAARLTWMNFLVSGIALMLVYVSLLAYNLYSFRESAIESLSSEAQIIGANSGSAITFDDPSSAETALSALSHSNDVVAAAIYTQGGVKFAQYPANGTVNLEPRPLPNAETLAYWGSGADVVIGSSIVLQGKPIGTVYLSAHLQAMRRRALRYSAIAGATLALCLGVAMLVGSVFRRILAQPLVAFAQTARLVSRYRDYSLRFTPGQSYDELSSLTEAFNEMLSEIQQRDKALETAKAELELRVEERTAQLQAANRELEAFSYTVAHDLRGPLQTISNVCFLIQATEQGEPSEERSSMLEQLRSSVTSMSHMINDLLDLSRSTSAPLHRKPVDLSHIASSILESLSETTPNRHVETIIEPKCQVNADPGLMQIVLQNLLRNSWKFTGRRDVARIEFGCTHRGKASVFFVRDNGAGFDQGYADRLFKPFQRLHASSEFPGIGIGLATVRRILTRHGGSVWAEGEIDAGATFFFTLDSFTSPLVEPSMSGPHRL